MCDYIENVECEEPFVPRECPVAVNITRIPHPDTCSTFTVCFDNIFNDRECQFGLHFSYYDGRCVDPLYADCDINKIICKESLENNDRPAFVENTRSCESYFLCMNKQLIIRNCAPGTHYDKENHWCDLEENVECKSHNDDPLIPDFDVLPVSVPFLCEGNVAKKFGLSGVSYLFHLINVMHSSKKKVILNL